MEINNEIRKRSDEINEILRKSLQKETKKLSGSIVRMF